MSAAVDPLTAAWRHTSRLQAALDKGWHKCWCGSFGAFQFARKGPWFCRSHVVRDADGFFSPILQS